MTHRTNHCGVHQQTMGASFFFLSCRALFECLCARPTSPPTTEGHAIARGAAPPGCPRNYLKVAEDGGGACLVESLGHRGHAEGGVATEEGL